MEFSPIQIHPNSQFQHFLTTEIPRALDQIFTATSKEEHLAACSTFKRNVSNFLEIQKRTMALLSLKHTALINICPVQGAPACNIICPATFHRQRIQALAEQIHQTLLTSRYLENLHITFSTACQYLPVNQEVNDEIVL